MQLARTTSVSMTGRVQKNMEMYISTAPIMMKQFRFGLESFTSLYTKNNQGSFQHTPYMLHLLRGNLRVNCFVSLTQASCMHKQKANGPHAIQPGHSQCYMTLFGQQNSAVDGTFMDLAKWFEAYGSHFHINIDEFIRHSESYIILC